MVMFKDWTENECKAANVQRTFFKCLEKVFRTTATTLKFARNSCSLGAKYKNIEGC